MPYGMLLSADAEAAIARLPLPVRSYTLQQLENLCQTPAALSRRSHFPYPEKCQVFSFDYDLEIVRWTVTALFQYGADEQTLHVIAIGTQTHDPWDGRPPD